ncbi:MAG: hypothetical protein R3E96_17585, partial [Planctomycetota bacterium]
MAAGGGSSPVENRRAKGILGAAGLAWMGFAPVQRSARRIPRPQRGMDDQPLPKRMMSKSCFARLAASASLLAFTACGGGGGGSSSGTAAVSGTLTVLQTTDVTVEAEPNDSAGNAHTLGTIGFGESRTVLGSITDSGSDPFDGFHVVFPQRTNVDVALTAANGASDLDFFLVDPVSLQFVDGRNTSAASEAGSFLLEGAVYVVVQSAAGTSDYELTISGSGLVGNWAEREPNDGSLQGEYLGSFVPGTSVQLVGTASAQSDEEWFTLAVPAAVNLNFALTSPGGTDFDILINDVTSDLSNPIGVAALDSAADGSEVGSFSATAMTLLSVVVKPFSGSGAWTLAVTVPSP